MKRNFFWNRRLYAQGEWDDLLSNLVMLYSIYWYSDQLHLLLRKNQGMFPQTWHLLCSYTHIYFAHLSPHGWDLGPVLLMCDADVNRIVLTSCLWAWNSVFFFTDFGSQTEPVLTVSPVVDAFHFNCFFCFFSLSWMDLLILRLWRVISNLWRR